jgi:hypothetical protein
VISEFLLGACDPYLITVPKLERSDIGRSAWTWRGRQLSAAPCNIPSTPTGRPLTGLYAWRLEATVFRIRCGYSEITLVLSGSSPGSLDVKLFTLTGSEEIDAAIAQDRILKRSVKRVLILGERNSGKVGSIWAAAYHCCFMRDSFSRHS